MNNANTIRSNKTNNITVQPETSGLRVRPKVGHIYIDDHEVKALSCLNESDMMVRLSYLCPFLSRQDNQEKVNAYLLAHFDTMSKRYPFKNQPEVA